jgi:hypothetical protein
MNIPLSLSSFLGSWQGTSQLFLPETPVRSSTMTATVSPLHREQFLQIVYTWSDNDEPQEGLLLVGAKQVVFTDTWHLANELMVCEVTPTENGISAFGTYKVEGHPNWGWRTVIESLDNNETLRIAMFNVPPAGQGDEELGFECVFRRV